MKTSSTVRNDNLVIGLVVDDTLDKPDGVQQYVQILGRWFGDQGHEVHYIVGQSYRTDFPNMHSMSRNIKVKFNGNSLTVPLPVPKQRIRRLFQDTQFDVLHVMSPHSPFMAQRVVCAAPTNTAVVSTFHILPHTWLVAKLTRVLGWCLRPSLLIIQVVVAVSDAARIFAEQAFKVKATRIPNAINVDLFKNAKAFERYADMPTIVSITRLVPRKGVQYLLLAVKYIIDKELYTKPFRLVVCGKGEMLEKLQQFVEDNKLSKVVELTGYVSEDDKPRYLASADLAVYPATGGESFGIVLLEAMAGSKGPTIGGDNAGYRSVLGSHPEQLINPKDTPAFAALLVDYLNNPQKRHQAVKWQNQAVKAYDASVVGNELIKIYRKAMHQAQHV